MWDRKWSVVVFTFLINTTTMIYQLNAGKEMTCFFVHCFHKTPVAAHWCVGESCLLLNAWTEIISLVPNTSFRSSHCRRFYFRTGLKCLFIELAADYVSISRNNEKIIGCYSWCIQCFTFERFRKCSTSFSKSRCCNSSSNQTSLTSVHLWLVLLKNGNNFSWHQSFGHRCEWCWYAILLHLVQFWKQFGDQWKCAGLKIRN